MMSSERGLRRLAGYVALLAVLGMKGAAELPAETGRTGRLQVDSSAASRVRRRGKQEALRG